MSILSFSISIIRYFASQFDSTQKCGRKKKNQKAKLDDQLKESHENNKNDLCKSQVQELSDRLTHSAANIQDATVANGSNISVGEGQQKDPSSPSQNCPLGNSTEIKERVKPPVGEKDANGVRILEALAASGLRSIRYAKEIRGIKEIIANDLSAEVCSLC